MILNKDISAKITTWFLHRLGGHIHRTGWVRHGECPNCGKDGKYGMNVYMDRTNCFSCGYHPKPIDLLMKVEQIPTYNEALLFIGTFDDSKLLDKQIKEISQKFGFLPEGYKLLTLGDSTYSKLARNYMKGRGFKTMKLSMRGVGYCTKGKYGGRIIIPFYEQGKIIYFNARQFINVGEAHKNPSNDEFGVGKSMLVYNVDCLSVYKKTYMVESSINALTIGDKAFGIVGKRISNYQLSKVIKSPCEEVVIILDPDAYWEGLRTGMMLAPHKKVKVVKLPMSLGKVKKVDVNSIGKKKTMEYVDNQPWQSYSDIYNKYISTPRPAEYLPKA